MARAEKPSPARAAGPERKTRRKPTRAPAAWLLVHRHVESHVRAGADPADFLCLDCGVWIVDPGLCACWSRALFEPS